MSNVRVCLIESNAFVREGLKSLMSQNGYSSFTEFSSLEDFRKVPQTNEYKLIILGMDDEHEDFSEVVGVAKSLYSKAKIVVLTSVLDSDAITECFSAGADGYIINDIAPQSFIGSLNLIMMGEKVFPTSMALLLSSGKKIWARNQNGQKDIKDYDFTQREFEIIECLANGESNKRIAQNLAITESTVKVHLKTILKKLNMSNRTQAAIWAVSHGLISAKMGVEDNSTITARG